MPKPMLPVTAAAARKLGEIGLSAVIEQIIGGATHSQIADSLGIGRSSLSAYLCNLRGEEAAVYTEAMRASAEALFQEAIDTLKAAPSTSADVQRARCIADILLRKAGVRDARWRERISESTAVTLMTPVESKPPPRFYVTVCPQPQRQEYGHTYNHDEPDG
ncbi:MAG: hypothetical protein GC183_11750 [Thiobacillus sp.]|nr:hypothetical protein [Thiobacillus sp.]